MAKLKRTRRKLSTPSASVETVRERVGSKSWCSKAWSYFDDLIWFWFFDLKLYFQSQ
jgi:hypothetical protein